MKCRKISYPHLLICRKLYPSSKFIA